MFKEIRILVVYQNYADMWAESGEYHEKKWYQIWKRRAKVKAVRGHVKQAKVGRRHYFFCTIGESAQLRGQNFDQVIMHPKVHNMPGEMLNELDRIKSAIK